MGKETVIPRVTIESILEGKELLKDLLWINDAQSDLEMIGIELNGDLL